MNYGSTSYQPDTPLRTAGQLLEGRQVCALVYKSDISVNYDSLEGNLQGTSRGLIAFDVLAVGSPADEVLPDVTIKVADVDERCNGPLVLFTEAAPIISSSEPSP